MYLDPKCRPANMRHAIYTRYRQKRNLIEEAAHSIILKILSMRVTNARLYLKRITPVKQQVLEVFWHMNECVLCTFGLACGVPVSVLVFSFSTSVFPFRCWRTYNTWHKYRAHSIGLYFTNNNSPATFECICK